MYLFYYIWRCFSVGLHAFGTTVYGFTIFYQMVTNDYTDPRSSYVGDFKYLTYWNLLFQFVFNSMSFVSDLLINRSDSKRYTQFLDSFFHCVSFPFSMFVCLTFWVLHYLDEKAVRNPNVRNRYPNWYNHITHSLNGPMNILELIVTYHQEPSLGHAILVLISLYMLYFLLTLFLGTFVDLWIYPFLANLYWSQRILFAIVCGIVLIVFYITGAGLNRIFWPQSRCLTFKTFFK